MLAAQNDHRNFEAFTPKVALNYKLTPAIALYTSAGFSFESPGGNELDNYPLSSQPGRLINPDLKAQEAAFFETGIKGGIRRPGQSYFKHILFETTLFNYQIDNEIVPFEVFSDVFFRNSAQTNRFGIETGGDVELVNGLNLNVAYTFSDFQYDNYTAEAIELDNSGNIVTNDRDFSGNIVPSVPRHNLMLSLSKSQRVAPGVRGFAKVDYQNISGLFVDDANSDKTENYQLWNTTLGFDISAGRFSMLLSGGVNNLSDESYVGFVNINSASGRFYEAGSPRNYFGTVKFSLTF